jgi:hypothetical protein
MTVSRRVIGYVGRRTVDGRVVVQLQVREQVPVYDVAHGLRRIGSAFGFAFDRDGRVTARLELDHDAQPAGVPVFSLGSRTDNEVVWAAEPDGKGDPVIEEFRMRGTIGYVVFEENPVWPELRDEESE